MSCWICGDDCPYPICAEQDELEKRIFENAKKPLTQNDIKKMIQGFKNETKQDANKND